MLSPQETHEEIVCQVNKNRQCYTNRTCTPKNRKEQILYRLRLRLTLFKRQNSLGHWNSKEKKKHLYAKRRMEAGGESPACRLVPQPPPDIVARGDPNRNDTSGERLGENFVHDTHHGLVPSQTKEKETLNMFSDTVSVLSIYSIYDRAHPSLSFKIV